ncbi:MAG: LysM peptidoglycan-binding domain-containing M23 family metallopeptidase [Hyphomicrobium sp.]|nr:LysM peptidoglycan-binding domain-containing M23 family metallopeptidase [Hyphomicrobium sp.]
MMSFPARPWRGVDSLRPARYAALVVTVLAAGCSADVTRFDSTSFNLNDPPGAESPPVPSEPVHSGSLSDNTNRVAQSTPRGPYGAGANSGDNGVDVAALPEPVTSQPPAASVRPFGTSPPQQTAYEPAARGETIEVHAGDTLYGLSKRHQVSLAELMSANNLTSPALKPGQKLVLPAAGGSGIAAASRPRKPSRPLETAALNPPASSPELDAKYGGSYVVKPGDSIYAIARSNKVSFAELQRVNGITDARKVRPGTVLKVPGVAPLAAAEAISEQPTADAVAAPASIQPAPVYAKPINAQVGEQKVAALNDKATDAVAQATPANAATASKQDKVAVAAPTASSSSIDSVKLRWPASGKVIAGFGGRPDGTHNDGINLSVPLGTDVHAAESGVIAYAGSELKGYGNLVLVRHDNGWVTAYAHNDELLVKRGDKVKRGQVIGKAGKTGTVDQPQVHFELRQGSKPVDPTPYMEQL